jgi:hypothetical protein
MKKLQALLLVIILAPALIPSADATLIVFQGNDPGAGPTDPRPNSDAARASFDAAAAAFGSISNLDFENLPAGNFINGPVDLGMGVTFSTSAIFSGIRDFDSYPNGGYNTTPGGTKYLDYLAEVLSVGLFTFARPIEAFGAYFTGIGTFPPAEVFVEFNDGSFHSFELERHSTGGVQFFGFMGLAHPISAVVIVERFGVDDVFGIDDVRFVATVSEPPAWLLIGFGLLGLGLIPRVVVQSDVALH